MCVKVVWRGRGKVQNRWSQRERLQAETDAELAEDAICAWGLDDIDVKALRAAFADLRRQLCS